MNSLSLLQVQQGVFGKLSSDGVLMAMLHALYDQVPERAQYPYAIIGDGSARPLQTDTPSGSVCSLRIRVYSQKPGRKEVLRILDRIYGLLHLGALPLSESDAVSVHVRSAQTQLLGDAKTIEGEMMLECLVSEVA